MPWHRVFVENGRCTVADRDMQNAGRRVSPDLSPSNGTRYSQLANVLREKIYSKEWPPHTLIPSEHMLMKDFGLSRGTVRRALKVLVDEGLLVQRHGKGTFVAEPGITHAAGVHPISFAESLHEQGMDFVTNVLDKRIESAPAEIAEALEIEPGSDVMFMRRVRTVEGEPVICQESWSNLLECPGLFEEDYTQATLFDAVEKHSKRKIQYSRIRYSARIAGKEHGTLLGCDEAAAVLLLEQTIYLMDGTPIEWSHTWLKPGQSVVGSSVSRD